MCHFLSASNFGASYLVYNLDHYQQACILTGADAVSDSPVLPTDEMKVNKSHLTLSDIMTIVVPALGFITMAAMIFAVFCCALCLFERRRVMKSKPYGNVLGLLPYA